MGKKYSNAASEYDNVINPSSKKSGLLSGLKSKLTSSINSISDGIFGKLNELKSKVFSFNLSALTGKLQGLLSGLLDSATSMLKSMIKDSIASLKNAGKNFAMNIVEQFQNDLKAMIFIEDKIFCQTIKALYYAGADLAYNNHYIRNSALTRDWNYTLEFLDKQYDIKYSLEYNKLTDDLDKCAKNGCYKNVMYIFGELLNARNSLNVEKSSQESVLPSLIYDPNSQKAIKATISTLEDNIAKYDELLVKYTKLTIVYSYSSFSPSRVKKLIKITNGIVLPKYFGTTDDKYSKKYIFNNSDVNNTMMPDFQQKLTKSDSKTLQDIDKQASEIEEENDELKDYANEEAEAGEALSSVASSWNSSGNIVDNENVKDVNKAAQYLKTRSKLDTFRANYRSKLTSQNKALSVTALKKGVSQVIEDNRARYHKNYDGSTVKYRKSAADLIDDFGESQENKYISCRNANIKAIYTLLSSQTIYGSNRMVNETYYKRCKMKSSTVLRASADKALGLIGASALVQSIYDISDIIDGSAYNYTVKVEKWLYDPKTNLSISDTFGSFGAMYFDTDTNSVKYKIDDENGNTIDTDNIQEVIDNPQSASLPSSSSTVSNEDTEKEIDDLKTSNKSAKKYILDITRYVDKIPIGTKRDILIKYLTWFYNGIISRKISEKIAKECFSRLIYKIFGRTGFDNPNKIEDLFINSNNNTLNKNLDTFVSISSLGLSKSYMKLSNYDTNTSNEIDDIYDMTVYTMSIEIKNNAFTKAVFLYDNDYMHTLAKQKYESQIKQLKNLNGSLESDKLKQFYSNKDNLTKTYDGFDRFGIFGFDERSGFVVKYTNVQTGDWNSILVGEEGTFFGGSDTTDNNGIRYLDTDSDTIKQTSIKSGLWNIIELNKRAFFINFIGNVYIWNSSKKDVVKIMNKTGNDYEYKEFPDYNLIFAIGKKNNGLMMFKDNNFISLSSTGSNFKWFKDNNIIVFYTDDGISKPIGVDVVTQNYFYISSINAPLTTPIRFTEDHVITTTINSTISNPDGTSTPVSRTEVTHNYKHHIMFGRLDNNGVLDCVNQNTDESNYSNSWIDDSSISISNKSICLVKISKNIYAIPVNSERTEDNNVTIIKPIYTQSYSQTITGTSSSSSSSNTTPTLKTGYEKTDYLHQYAKLSNLSVINDTVFFKADYLNGTTWETKFFVHKYNDSVIDEMSVSSKDSIKFYNPDKDNLQLIFGKDSANNLYYFNPSKNIIKALFSESKYIVDGWKYCNINRKYAQLYNENAPIGVILYDNDNNSIIKTNLTTQYWKVLEGNKYFYALSQNGTNKGVLYSKKPLFNFTDITSNDVSRYDINGFVYDSSLKRTYLGVERSKNILNVDSVNYDINEFIYLKNAYELYKLNETNSNLDTQKILDDLSDKLAGVDKSAIKTLTSSEIVAGPVSGKEYFINDESSGELISVGNSLTSFDQNETYYKQETEVKKTNSFDHLSADDIKNGPITGQEYYTKDLSGRLISVGNVIKFDSSKEYYIKNTIDNTSKYRLLNDSEKKLGPISNKEYCKKRGDNYISLGNSNTKFSEAIDYYIENNPIESIPIISYEMVDKDVDSIQNIEYFEKNSEYGYFESVGYGFKDITEFKSDKAYYISVQNRSSDPSIESSIVEVTDKSSGPLSNIRYFISDNDGNYHFYGTGNVDFTDFDDSTTYYIVKESEIISNSTKSTSEILNDLIDTWSPYVESLSEIEKSSPFYTDLAMISASNEEFDVDDPNEVDGMLLDLILGDEGKTSKAYLLMEDNTKYIIKTVDEKYKDLKPGTTNWNLINETSSIDFLNSDETDIENVPTSN